MKVSTKYLLCSPDFDSVLAYASDVLDYGRSFITGIILIHLEFSGFYVEQDLISINI